MDNFIFEWDHILFFKGVIKLDEISQAIWEEFLDVKTLADAQRWYKLQVETCYYHWGRGLDDDGNFHQQIFVKKRSRSNAQTLSL